MKQALRLVCVPMALVTALHAAISDRLESDLRKQFEKKAVLIRHFYEGPLLRYDNSLTAVGAKEGSWTLTGYVELKRVRVKNGAVEIEGRRLAALYDEKQRNMRLSRYDEPVVINLPIESDEDAYNKLGRIFVSLTEDVTKLVPSYWLRFAQTHEIVDLSKPGPMSGIPKAELRPDVYRVGGDVSPPRPTFKPEPEFTDFARRFRIQGSTGVTLVVNENGEAEDISIVKPLGAGLDEAAVNAVKKWRFEPARKSGRPVKSQILIDIGYHLGL